MKQGWVTFGALLVSACGGSSITPEEQARENAAAVASVEATQDVPAVPISPQPIAFEDIEINDLFGAGCAFTPSENAVSNEEQEPTSNEASPPILALTMAEGGYFKLDDTIVKLAPDAGSAAMPLNTRLEYDGTRYSMKLAIDTDEGNNSVDGVVDYPAVLVIRDRRENPVYEMRGAAQCGS